MCQSHDVSVMYVRIFSYAVTNCCHSTEPFELGVTQLVTACLNIAESAVLLTSWHWHTLTYTLTLTYRHTVVSYSSAVPSQVHDLSYSTVCMSVLLSELSQARTVSLSSTDTHTALQLRSRTCWPCNCTVYTELYTAHCIMSTCWPCYVDLQLVEDQLSSD